MMRTLNLNLSLLVVLSVWISGCCIAKTTLLPQGDQATIIATSEDGSCCVRRALEKAEAHCKAQGGSLNVVSEDTQYQGVNKKAKAVVGMISAVTGADASLDTDEDYRTELKFNCNGDETSAPTNEPALPTLPTKVPVSE